MCEEDEFCSDNLDRRKWRVGRRVYNASNRLSSRCINIPVTSSTSLHTLGGRRGGDIFSGPRASTFPPNTHQSWCFKGKVPARNSKISIQPMLMCLGTFPITTAKMSKPATSSTASLIIHRRMLLKNVWFIFMPALPLPPLFPISPSSPFLAGGLFNFNFKLLPPALVQQNDVS